MIRVQIQKSVKIVKIQNSEMKRLRNHFIIISHIHTTETHKTINKDRLRTSAVQSTYLNIKCKMLDIISKQTKNIGATQTTESSNHT